MDLPAPSTVAARRRWYLEWIVDTFSEMGLSDLDGRAWSLNHARLVLNRDLDQANEYFAGVELTRDRDFTGIRLLRTLLDIGPTGRLSASAKEHIEGTIAGWEMNEFSYRTTWPPANTENHDIMFLTIGLFSEKLRGEDIRPHIRELSQSLAWRFQRGWVEWNSPRYQLHYVNPLMVLVDYAPSPGLRQGAGKLLNLQLAERALLSVNGYLAGPFFRGWDRHAVYEPDGSPTQRGPCAYFDNNRYDGYLPTVWLAFGLSEPYFDYTGAEGLEPAGEGYGCRGDARLNQDDGLFFACSEFQPHPIVSALAAEAADRPSLIYKGTRHAGWPPDDMWAEDLPPHQIYYYNTPHVSMGSLQLHGWSCQTRYNSIMFAAEPAQNLRIELVTPGVEWDRRRHERRAELVQHEGWLLGRGELIEDGGVQPTLLAEPWRVYRVGEGLAAHTELPGGYHVIQVSDTTRHHDEGAFLAALDAPTIAAHAVTGAALSGDTLEVDTRDMSIRVNGVKREPWYQMLHDSEPMRAEYDRGVVEIRTNKGSVTLDHSDLLEELAEELR